MFYEDNNTAKLLDMEDVIVKKVENNGEEVHISIELPRKIQICPRCGMETNRVHDYREQKIKDILLNRTEQDLRQYFFRFKNRNCVKYFVCDMNPHFRSVAKEYFLDAKIVADRCHVTPQVIWAMEAVRKAEQ